MSIASKLAALSNAADMHDLFCAMAADPECRWTRTQILHFLPGALGNVAAEYFVGERLVIPKLRPIHIETPDALELEEALKGLGTTEKSDAQGDTDPFPRVEVSALCELQADPPRGDDDIIGNVLAAILEEAKVVDRDTPKRYRLTDGRCIGPHGDGYLYTFRWSSEPDLFQPGQLCLGQAMLPARVGRQAEGERRFELYVDEFLDPTIARAVFRIDPTFLLRAAFQKLKLKRDVFDSGAELAQSLFSPPDNCADPHAGDDGSGLNARQRQAVAVVSSERRSYVWGPPGTGKTTTLGHLIRRLATKGQRVLVLSPYNIAVDEAVLAAKKRGGWESEQIVRVGRISDTIRGAEIDLDSLLERRADASGLLHRTRAFHASVCAQCGLHEQATPATVRRCLEELGELYIKLGGRRGGEGARKVKDGVRAIRQQYREPERRIIRDARVVGTTVALSYISPVILERAYDHIVVDEASVVRVPEALLVALEATGRLSFFGDPKQLPSIVRHKSPATERWLKPSPFALASISSPDDARGSCVMLNEQHRMAPPIRQLVSTLFYDGKLVDGHCPKEGRLLWVDTGATPARTTTKWVRMGPSKENLVHRSVTSALLRAIREKRPDDSILVLSPYAAQKRAYDAEANTNRVSGVRFTTVHTSQGTEGDVVILDLVIAPGRGKSRFMNERTTPEFRNLMNVAMSRARKQLILVGSAAYIRKEYPKGLLDEIRSHVQANAQWLDVPADLRMRAAFASAV